MVNVAGSMVQQQAPHPDERPPHVTRMEGRAFRELLKHLDVARGFVAHAQATADVQPLEAAAEQWRTATTPLRGRISFRNVEERVDVVGRVLSRGGSANDPEEIRLFADIADAVIDDVGRAFRRALRREPMGQSGAMWPYLFDNLAREDAEKHGGRPVAFSTWLDEYRRTNPSTAPG